MSFDKQVISISGNDDTTVILTNNGEIYSAGMVNHKVQPSFQLQTLTSYLTSPIIDVVQTQNNTFVLTQDGSVYEFNGTVKEIYLPSSNNNDPIVSISAGTNHIIMLSKNNLAYGFGDNSKYQLVPSGECYYNHAIQIELNEYINITNMNCPDDCYVNNGALINSSNVISPVSCNVECDTVCGTTCTGVIASLTGNATITVPVSISLPNSFQGPIVCQSFEMDVSAIPLTTTISKDCNNVVNYTIYYSLSNVVIPPTNIMYAVESNNGFTCNTITTNTVVNCSIDPNEQQIKNNTLMTISGNVVVPNQCGQIMIEANIQIPLCGTILVYEDESQSITASAQFPNDPETLTVTISGVLCINCPPCNQPVQQPKVKQPNIVKIDAGGYNTVLVDDKNRIYTMGDISSVRQNKNLVNNCLSNLLANTYGTIKAPANQICQSNCSNGTMDLSKFNVELSLFPNVDVNQQYNTNPQPSINVCDFLTKLKDCNTNNCCTDICKSCDNTIYIRNNRTNCLILSSRKAVLKGLSYLKSINCNSTCIIDDLATLLSSNKASCVSNTVSLDMSTDRIQIDQNEYFINGVSYPTDMFLILCNIVNPQAVRTGYDLMYIDVEKGPQAIQFITTATCFNIVYSSPTYSSPNSNCSYPQISVYSMIFGDVLPPVERNNYRSILANYGFRHSYNYKNPITNKLYGSYLQGGDYIDMVSVDNMLMVTYDVPTVYTLNKRILDISVSNNSLYVVASTMISCPNDVFVLGNNCLGQLGLCNNFNTLCFKKINNCKTDSQIVKVFAGENAVAVITFNGFVYMAGILDGVINSTCLTYYECGCKTKPTKIVLTKYNMIQLTTTKSVYGVGLNQLGQLGTGNTCKVCKCVLLDSTVRSCAKVCPNPYTIITCPCPTPNPCPPPCPQPKCNQVVTTPNFRQKSVVSKCKYFK